MRGTEERARPAAGREGQPAARPAGRQPGNRQPGGRSGHHRANVGSWVAVLLIIVGFGTGAFALATHLVALWILTGVALVAGGAIALASRIMDQAYY
ncbi:MULTISPECIES: hypothetical protein [unclassified Pseudofrankia]|uniref:hypothetical protein n=1 Tax=unclassified Pseudofrankia TaxID=2994372 RepID=UPI001041F748|nr:MULTISPECIES: hypothetical protein [unclassified Pseudofrankia]MDT3441566.1 hypothetical protein [Pseudofrankia sp. BMG5.37]